MQEADKPVYVVDPRCSPNSGTGLTYLELQKREEKKIGRKSALLLFSLVLKWAAVGGAGRISEGHGSVAVGLGHLGLPADKS